MYLPFKLFLLTIPTDKIYKIYYNNTIIILYMIIILHIFNYN